MRASGIRDGKRKIKNADTAQRKSVQSPNAALEKVHIRIRHSQAITSMQRPRAQRNPIRYNANIPGRKPRDYII